MECHHQSGCLDFDDSLDDWLTVVDSSVAEVAPAVAMIAYHTVAIESVAQMVVAFVDKFVVPAAVDNYRHSRRFHHRSLYYLTSAFHLQPPL